MHMTQTMNSDPAPDGAKPGRSRPSQTISRTKIAILATSGALALATGVGVTSMAMADPTPTPTAPSGSYPPGPSGGPGQRARDPRGGHLNGELATKLASKLGIDQAKVTQALQAVRADQRDQQKPAAKPDPATRRAELAKALAEKLGIDQAQVAAALAEIETEATADRKEALQQRLDEAVTAGKLTRAEADAVMKAAEAGVIPTGGGPR